MSWANRDVLMQACCRCGDDGSDDDGVMQVLQCAVLTLDHTCIKLHAFRAQCMLLSRPLMCKL